MLETIAIVLVILWLLGLVTSYTMGGFIHILFGGRPHHDPLLRVINRGNDNGNKSAH